MSPRTDTDSGPADALVRLSNKKGVRLSGMLPWGIFLLLIGGCLAGIFLSPTKPMVGGFIIAMMVILVFFRVPVAVSLMVPSIIGLYAVTGIPAAVNMLAVAPYTTASKWTMAVLPMFIFLGMALTESGMASKIYTFTGKWFGWLPGGAGIATTLTGAGLASVSGSTIGMTYTLGRAGIPEMLRRGYDKRLAIGVVIIAGLPGMLIPPSVLLVVYAGIANVPIGPQLIAGTVPGVLLALFFALIVLVLGLVVPRLFGNNRAEESSGGDGIVRGVWAERFIALRDIWGVPVIVLVLVGGMFTGVFTATEAGAAGALVAVFLMLWYRRRSNPWGSLAKAAFETIAASAAIFFILIGAEMLTRVLAVTGLAQAVTDLISGFGLPRVAFLLVLVVVYLVMGMFFDTLSMMLLTVPLLLPSLIAMEVNPLWFGVFVVLMAEIGMLTPPLGILSFVVHGLAQAKEVNLGHKITLMDVFAAVLWFLPLALLFVVAMILFPEMVTWLPELMRGTG